MAEAFTEVVLQGSGGGPNYQSWSLDELRAAVAAAQGQMSAIDAMHSSFAESSHQLARLGDSIGLSRNAVAANWVGPAGSAAAQSSSNLQAYSLAAHDASYQSATATRELHRATRNHAGNMNQIKDVDTSYHQSLARSGGNPAAATVDHHQRVQESEQNRQAAVREAQLLDAKGDEYHSMMKQTQWPTMTNHGSTAPPKPTRYPVLPPGEPLPPAPTPLTPGIVTPGPTDPVTPVPGSKAPDHVEGSRVTGGSGSGGTSTAGLAGGEGGGAAGSGGATGSGNGSGLGGGLGGSGSGVTGGLAGEGALAGSGGARPGAGADGARGGSSRPGLAEEGRGSGRAGAFAGEEGRGGLYGPGGGARRNGDDDEEKRRPDYLEEDDDPWGLGIANAVPAVIGDEEEH